VDLIGFVIARQHMHHQIDAKAVGQFSLPLACKAAAHGIKRVAARIHSPCSGPIIAADDHRAHPVIKVPEGHTIDLHRVGRGRFDPDIARRVAAREVLQQVVPDRR